LTSIADFTWKSSILARERGAIEEGFLIAIHPSSLLLDGFMKILQIRFLEDSIAF